MFLVAVSKLRPGNQRWRLRHPLKQSVPHLSGACGPQQRQQQLRRQLQLRLKQKPGER